MTASALGAVAAGHTLSSPDGHITVTFDNKDAVPYYSVDVDGSPLINPSRLGIVSEEWSQPKSKVRVARSATDKTPPFPVDEKGRPVFTEEMKKAMEERGKLNVPTGSGIVDWKAVKAAADAQRDGVIYVVEREANYGGKSRIDCLKEDIAWLKANV